MEYYNSFNGGTLWGPPLNTSGFMGFVDNVWIFMQRITTILAIVSILIVLIVICLGGGKESFNLSRLRQTNKRYT